MNPIRVSYALAVLLLLTEGCSLLWSRSIPPAVPQLKVLVAPITLAAPVTSTSDLHSFTNPPSEEVEPFLLKQLIDEVQQHGQRVLTDELSRRPSFLVVPFSETRRTQPELSPGLKSLNDGQLRALGRQAGVDLVISGQILDYGNVQLSYWVTGFVLSMLTETLIVGAATGWNPLIMAATAGSELFTDLPFWWGGAYVAGWAFRPVRVEIEAVQTTDCEESIWNKQELVVLVPGKTLDEYPPEERRRKEVQLEVNLTRVLSELADAAERELRLKPCSA